MIVLGKGRKATDFRAMVMERGKKRRRNLWNLPEKCVWPERKEKGEGMSLCIFLHSFKRGGDKKAQWFVHPYYPRGGETSNAKSLDIGGGSADQDLQGKEEKGVVDRAPRHFVFNRRRKGKKKKVSNFVRR